MHSYFDLLLRYKTTPGSRPPETEPVHASLAAYPNRLKSLNLAINSLLKQVDTLHVFLNDFQDIPDFLDHDKIFLTRSEDFGNLGECGKYYWTDDLTGYHLICSDKLVYPENYVEQMKVKVEEYGRKAVIGAGGYRLADPFMNFSESATPLSETDNVPADIQVPLLNDVALIYHSSSIKVSRHYFYQPELSAIWFSIIGLEQKVPLICCKHDASWLAEALPAFIKLETPIDPIDYRTFLIKSYFISDKSKEVSKPMDINSFFDKIYVMNLDRRPDRWKKIRQTAKKHRLKITRFPAIDGYKEPAKSAWINYNNSGTIVLPEGIDPLVDYKDKFLKYHHYIARIHFMETKLGRKAMQSPGAWGYALSYISILKEAIKNDYQRILICDDDIILHKSFNSEFEKHVRHLPGNWRLIMLGAMQHQWEPWITPYSDMLYHCHGSSVASHAVGIDRKVFLPLLFYSEKLDLPIDEGAVFHIQNIYSKQCFIFRPNLAIQDIRESDISSSAMKVMDMDKWMKLFRWNPDDYDYDLMPYYKKYSAYIIGLLRNSKRNK